MANSIQRFIYHIANAVPLAIMTAVVWYIQKKTIFIPTCIIGTTIIVVFLFVVSYNHVKNNCQAIKIRASSISSKDGWIVAYILSYCLPFASLVLSDYNVMIFAIIAIIGLIFLMISVSAIPNFLLFISGYHFYEISTEETGVSDYLLISKRKRLRNKTEIQLVLRPFERILIDEKGDA